jgi:hypothetical protein
MSEIGYVTQDEADSYFANRLYSEAWDDASNADQIKALHTAHVLLDGYISWRGTPTVEGQDNAWPRSGVDGIGSDVIPKSVILAQMELALYLLKKDVLSPSETDGFQTIQVDKIKLEVNPATAPGVIPDVILAIVSAYGHLKGSALQFEVSR